MQICLYQPEIPPNTGNIARLCAATGTRLHLIEPLGFSLEDRYLRRAGLDYWPYVQVQVWPGWEAFAATLASEDQVVLTSTHAEHNLFSFSFTGDETLVLGPETKGLPPWMAQTYRHHLRIPIQGTHVRSLNISNAAAVCLFEALRQSGKLGNDE